MTTLQEARRALINARDDLHSCIRWHNGDVRRNSQTASERVAWEHQRLMLQASVNRIEDTLRTALAQQDNTVTALRSQVEYLEKIVEDQAKALAQQGEPVCAGCGIPAGDVHMSTCKSGKWPSRVSNGDTAAPAPQAQSILASAVLALNTLWNKSSVKDSAIADRLAVCRVLAESDDDMELTDAQILTLWEETYVQRGWTGIEFARAIERAHGIGVKQ